MADNKKTRNEGRRNAKITGKNGEDMGADLEDDVFEILEKAGIWKGNDKPEMKSEDDIFESLKDSEKGEEEEDIFKGKEDDKENPESSSPDPDSALIVEEDREGNIRVYRRTKNGEEEVQEYSALYRIAADAYKQRLKLQAEYAASGIKSQSGFISSENDVTADAKISESHADLPSQIGYSAGLMEKRIAELDYPVTINGQYVAQRLIFRNEMQQSVLDSILGTALEDGLPIKIEFREYVDRETGRRGYAPMITEVNGIRDGQDGMFFEVYASKGKGDPFEILKDNIGNASVGEGYGIEIRRGKETAGGCGPASEWKEYKNKILEKAGSYARRIFGLDDFGFRRRFGYG